jgi:hypothetical protein
LEYDRVVDYLEQKLGVALNRSVNVRDFLLPPHRVEKSTLGLWKLQVVLPPTLVRRQLFSIEGQGSGVE